MSGLLKKTGDHRLKIPGEQPRVGSSPTLGSLISFLRSLSFNPSLQLSITHFDPPPAHIRQTPNYCKLPINYLQECNRSS